MLQRLHRLGVERGQLGNSTAGRRGRDAGAQVGAVHEVGSDAGQVRQVGRHVDLRDLAQVRHVEIVFSYLKETQSKRVRQGVGTRFPWQQAGAPQGIARAAVRAAPLLARSPVGGAFPYLLSTLQKPFPLRELSATPCRGSGCGPTATSHLPVQLSPFGDGERSIKQLLFRLRFQSHMGLGHCSGQRIQENVLLVPAGGG